MDEQPTLMTVFESRSFPKVWASKYECLNDDEVNVILTNADTEPEQLKDHPKAKGGKL